jgi:hypothetical protein
MPGGLLNIISYGNQNIIVNGNPSKTFFKTVYSKYTNFGMQKFRIDHEGQRNLKLNEETSLTFKIPRNAELLMDAYLVFNLPDIWSPIIPPSSEEQTWRPYNFRWISHIGANIIKKMSVSIGGQKIQEYSGEYLKNMAERDFSQTKKDLFYKMIGHTRDIIDGKGEYALSYMQIFVWNSFFPELAKYALLMFVTSTSGDHPFGSWKDIKYFCNYCKQKYMSVTDPLMQYAFSLINAQLSEDVNTTS